MPYVLCDVHQIVLTLNESMKGSEDGQPSVVVAHDASAEEMQRAIERLLQASWDGSAGQVVVSREQNGPEGLQAYRCGGPFTPQIGIQTRRYDIAGVC